MPVDSVSATTTYNPYAANAGAQTNQTAAAQRPAEKPPEPERTQVQSIPANRTDRNNPGQGSKIDLTA